MRLFFMLSVFLSGVSFSLTAQETSELPLADQLKFALLQEDTDTIKEIVDTGVDLDLMISDGRPLIITAAVEGSPEILEFLVHNGANPNSQDVHGYSAVMKALEFGRVDNAKKLHDLGASLKGISDDGYTVRLLAERVGLEDFGPIYAKSYIQPISREQASELLLFAAEAGDLETVKFALKSGAKLNAKAENSWSAIMLAALGGHSNVFQELSKRGALGYLIDPKLTASGVDVVTAILVGQGGGDEANVIAMLQHLQREKYRYLNAQPDAYQAIVERLNYGPLVSAIFPKTYDPQPQLKNDIPYGVPSTKENWKLVQGVLKRAGLYKGPIDGSPGPQTDRALFAYYRPLIAPLRANAINAAKAARSENSAPNSANHRFAMCKYMQIGGSEKAVYGNVCGEFQKGKTPSLAGYAFTSPPSYWPIYTYFDSGYTWKGGVRPAQLVEYGSKRPNSKVHSRFRVKILDTYFAIEIEEKLMRYGRSNSSKKQTLPGSFPAPMEPFQ